MSDAAPDGDGDSEDGVRLALGGLAVAVFSWMAAGAVLLLEAVTWLKTGRWPRFTAALAERYLPVQFTEWLAAPDDWFGVHRMVAPLFEAPLSAFVIVVGTLVAVVAVAAAVGIMRLGRRPTPDAADP